MTPQMTPLDLELMNALEWLMGYGGHEMFHHRQIDALIQLDHRRA